MYRVAAAAAAAIAALSLPVFTQGCRMPQHALTCCPRPSPSYIRTSSPAPSSYSCRCCCRLMRSCCPLLVLVLMSQGGVRPCWLAAQSGWHWAFLRTNTRLVWATTSCCEWCTNEQGAGGRYLCVMMVVGGAGVDIATHVCVHSIFVCCVLGAEC